MDRVRTPGWIRRPIAIFLGLMLAAPFSGAQQMPADQQAGAPAQAQSSQNSANGAAKPDAGATAPAAPSDVQAPLPSQAAQEEQQNTHPVGTAAAPYEKPIGAAVSRPAGAAIAPGKQRRRRSFLIKVGLVAGAAVAVGTVVALSKGSPSQPNH
jgi:hypothetical protein